jgi:hypothetical protein
MPTVSYSWSPDSNFVDPKIASYYPFEYCGSIPKFRWRNPDTNEIAAVKNRAQGVCIVCIKEIMRSQG